MAVKENSAAKERGYMRIATEEAFNTPEIIRQYEELLKTKSLNDPGFESLEGFYMTSQAERPKQIKRRLQDLGEGRIADMDAAGVDMQILALTAPGVQVFDPATGTSLAADSNDRLTEAIRTYPDRFAGLAAAAPQDPKNAAKEIERGVKKLGLKGVIINSHIQGEYLSDKKFWDIFEAAEALDVPIYLHPNTPPAAMIGPMLESGLDGAIFGFGVETGMHMLKIIVSGAFDRFPNLKIIIGHMGEALPFWLYRLDFMHAATVRANRYEAMKPLKKTISDYMQENIYITNSGVAWEPAITFTQNVVGVDRVMYAMDYPYQYAPEEVPILDNMSIAAGHKKKFFQTNAERIFSL
ncbi:MAG: amidohydrolase family protein [Gammaproteobacteria bacterium]